MSYFVYEDAVLRHKIHKVLRGGSTWRSLDFKVAFAEAVVFICQADSIQEADRFYVVAVGQNPSKQLYVGCSSVMPDDIRSLGSMACLVLPSLEVF